MLYLFYCRTKNLLCIVAGFFLSVFLKRPISLGLPITTSIEPANYCNLHCTQCPTGNGSIKKEKELMPMELFSQIVNDIKRHTLYITLYFQGEPFLNPEFGSMIKLAHQEHIFTATSTNGQLINSEIAECIVRSGLNKLIISIDGTTQETYEKYRIGGNLEKAISAIGYIVEWKKKLHSNTPKIEMQFLVFKHNEHQLDDAKKLAIQTGVDKLTFKTAQIYDFENGNELIPSQQKYSRYIEKTAGTFVRKKKIYNRCWRAFSGAVITSAGEILPCSFDKKGEFSFGNIKNQSLAEIWNNEKALRFRKQLLVNREEIGICRNCVE